MCVCMRACYHSVSFNGFGSRPCVLEVHACTCHCATYLDRLKGIMGDEGSVVTVILPLCISFYRLRLTMCVCSCVIMVMKILKCVCVCVCVWK